MVEVVIIIWLIFVFGPSITIYRKAETFGKDHPIFEFKGLLVQITDSILLHEVRKEGKEEKDDI